MAVYVDNMQTKYRNMVMCHMLADTKDELLSMIDKLGIDRRHIQYENTYKEHFDISLGKKKIAIREGAIEIDRRQLVNLLRQRREMKKKISKNTKEVVLICKVKTVSKKYNLIPFNVFTISEDDKDIFEKRAYGSFDIVGYWIQNIKDRRIKIFKDEFFELNKSITSVISNDDFKYMYTTIINYIQSRMDDDHFLKFIHKLRLRNFDFMDFLHILEAKYYDTQIEEEELEMQNKSNIGKN